MKRLVIALATVFLLTGCATDVLVSSGTAAETKKQESEQATATKKQAEDSLQDSLEKNEERKKKLEEQ